jgi:hypothetical protein
MNGENVKNIIERGREETYVKRAKSMLCLLMFFQTIFHLKKY